MDTNILLGAFGLVICAITVEKLRKRRLPRRYKCRPLNRNRNEKNAYIYFRRMKDCDPNQFFKSTRMTVPVFDVLHGLVNPLISKAPRRDGICSEQRLAITLHYLSQGGSMQNLAWAYHVGISTIHQIIYETCEAIWDVLNDRYMKSPMSEDEWITIATGFFEVWNFPNCIGAIDGKHIQIQAPPKSGSLYFNYKKNFSIILLAACDANYLSTMIDIRAYGSQSDGGVFKNSIFGQNFEENTMNVPEASEIPHTDVKIPYCLVADEAFPLKTYIMRPFPGKYLSTSCRIFNYRLSRARRTIENTFSILVARWRILKQSIIAKPDNVDSIVKCCVVLHNFCKLNGIGKTPSTTYCPPGYIDHGDQDNGGWRSDIDGIPLTSIGRLSANNASRITYNIRETIMQYFLSDEGKLQWQYDIVTKRQEPNNLNIII